MLGSDSAYPIAYDDPRGERHQHRPVEATRGDHRREVAVVVFPPVALLGRVTLSTTADVDDDDAPFPECVEEPCVLLGGLPHPGHNDHRWERRVVDAIVERVDADSRVVGED